MVNRLFFLTIVAIVGFLSFNTLSGQVLVKVDDGWNWVIPLSTQRAEIEKAFGDSITEDKSSPYQTYVAKFGKITIIYAIADRFIKECSCTVSKGTVIEALISPYRFPLNKLNLDLNKFKKDSTFSPRELSYFNESEGVLIVTEIVETREKAMVERVVWIEYRPKPKQLK